MTLLGETLGGEPDPDVRPVEVEGVAVGDGPGADAVLVEVAEVVAVDVAIGCHLPVGPLKISGVAS